MALILDYGYIMMKRAGHDTRWLKTGLICLLLFGWHELGAQLRDFPHDSTYFKTYPAQLTGRIYFSKKYTSLYLEGKENVRTLHYRPNTPVTLGVGATYRILSLNVGLGLQFLNPNKDEKGKTKYLDLQSHLYAPKWVIDLFGQFYKGYYTVPKGYASPDQNKFYVRPDIKVNMIGVSAYRLVNGERLSYRAAFLQNEWQKKSAGSFLFGGEIYTGVTKGDSALVPVALNDYYGQFGIYKTTFTEFGPGIGYAYTLVVKKHFFATASVTVTGDLSFVKEVSALRTTNHTSFTPNLSLRSVLGYNSDKWALTMSWVNTNTNLRGASTNNQYLIRTGNFRFTVAKRFRPSRRLREKLDIIPESQVK